MAVSAVTTTSPIGMGQNSSQRFAQAFTLVELILVMALLATLMAFAAPSLSSSLRQRNVEQEAMRFLALTEQGRSTAVSQGLPMTVWIDPASRRFGLEPAASYSLPGGYLREYSLNPDVDMEIANAPVTQGKVHAAEFSPDGTMGLNSAASVRFLDRFGSAVTVQRTSDRWGYAVAKDAE